MYGGGALIENNDVYENFTITIEMWLRIPYSNENWKELIGSRDE